ncbi:unnamed protein product [Ascophyllum nodosum]
MEELNVRGDMVLVPFVCGIPNSSTPLCNRYFHSCIFCVVY